MMKMWKRKLKKRTKGRKNIKMKMIETVKNVDEKDEGK